MNKLFNTYEYVQNELEKRLLERAPGKIQIIIGPRQTGKTTLLLKLAEKFGEAAVYCAADSPEASLRGWWEAQWKKAENIASANRAILLIDELQYLPAWSRLLKARFDLISKEKKNIHVVVSGSSALRLSKGSKESMAGRFEQLKISHWPAAALSSAFNISESDAADAYVRFGSYPGAFQFIDNYQRWYEYVKTAIIEPAIGRDIMALETIRKPALLRQIFAVAAGHPAEIFSLQKLCGELAQGTAGYTVSHYLDIMEESCLIASIRKYSKSQMRQRASPPKLVCLNNALLSFSGLTRPDKIDSAQFGRRVENACIAFAVNCGQGVYYWRAEPFEVDMIIEGSWGKYACEIKTGPFAMHELAGLFEFCKINNDFTPVIICGEDELSTAERAGVKAVSWKKYLVKGFDD